MLLLHKASKKSGHKHSSLTALRRESSPSGAGRSLGVCVYPREEIAGSGCWVHKSRSASGRIQPVLTEIQKHHLQNQAAR